MATKKKPRRTRSDRVVTDAEFRRAFKAVLREHGPAFKALADYDAGKPLAWKDEGQWTARVRGLRGVYGVGRTRRAAEADLRAAVRELDDYAARMRVTFDRETDGRHIAQIKKLPGCLAYGKTKAEAEARVRKLARAIVRERAEDIHWATNDDLQQQLKRTRAPGRPNIPHAEVKRRLGLRTKRETKKGRPP